MRVYIEAPGDPSVGIPSGHFDATIPEPEDGEDREWMRDALRECYTKILDEELLIWFEDEIDEK